MTETKTNDCYLVWVKFVYWVFRGIFNANGSFNLINAWCFLGNGAKNDVDMEPKELLSSKRLFY